MGKQSWLVKRRELKSTQSPDDPRRWGKKTKQNREDQGLRQEEKVESSESEVKVRMSGIFKTQILEMWKNWARGIFLELGLLRKFKGLGTRTYFLMDKET